MSRLSNPFRGEDSSWMLAIRDKHWVIKCNECPIRMELGPAAMPEERLRLPSGWLDLGDGAHACIQCAPRWTAKVGAVADFFSLPAHPERQLARSR